ncbi:MAG: site-specific integrase [Lachnospiraceae bacterium]|nr:site-specific integrase [Lachnospiraceae bacterium]
MPTIRFAKGRKKLKKGEYQRPNGTFEYKWTDRYGSRHSVYAKTLLELRIKEEAILKDTLDGIKCLNQNMTINSYFEIWQKIKSGIRESSLKTYLRLYQRYIEPQFGNTKLKDLSYSTIVMFYKDLIENRGLGVSSVGNLNVVLSMILGVAIRDGVLRNNPCTGAMKELQRKYADTVKEVKALTTAEQELLEEFLSRPGTYHCLYPLITVMLYTGMRVGEIGALRWADVDFEKNKINISHTLLFEEKPGQKGSVFSLNPPKTKTSERRIPMNPRVKEALLTEKRRQEANGITCNITVDGYSDFVFLDDKGGLFHYKKLNHRLDRISLAIDAEIKSKGEINGLTVFPHVHSHMLRHTFATRMREAGADIKATADIMGHTEVELTLNTYTDASEEFKRQEISLLEPKRAIKTKLGA